MSISDLEGVTRIGLPEGGGFGLGWWGGGGSGLFGFYSSSSSAGAAGGEEDGFGALDGITGLTADSSSSSSSFSQWRDESQRVFYSELPDLLSQISPTLLGIRPEKVAAAAAAATSSSSSSSKQQKADNNNNNNNKGKVRSSGGWGKKTKSYGFLFPICVFSLFCVSFAKETEKGSDYFHESDESEVSCREEGLSLGD